MKITEDIRYLIGTELAMPDSSLEKLNQYISKGLPIPIDVKVEIRTINMDRDVALKSMDKDKIISHASKHGVDMSILLDHEEDFWAAVHIAITATESLPMSTRIPSKKWLMERGLEVLDDGRIPV